MEIRTEPPAWSLFRRRLERDLWCAIPADAAVPNFLFSGDWDFGGQHRHPDRVRGFQAGPARQAIDMNGFYLFQRTMAAS